VSAKITEPNDKEWAAYVYVTAVIKRLEKLAQSLPEDAALHSYIDDARDSLTGLLGWFVGGLEKEDFDEVVLAADRIVLATERREDSAD
jgi:hypothetical protein